MFPEFWFSAVSYSYNKLELHGSEENNEIYPVTQLLWFILPPVPLFSFLYPPPPQSLYVFLRHSDLTISLVTLYLAISNPEK